MMVEEEGSYTTDHQLRVIIARLKHSAAQESKTANKSVQCQAEGEVLAEADKLLHNGAMLFVNCFTKSTMLCSRMNAESGGGALLLSRPWWSRRLHRQSAPRKIEKDIKEKERKKIDKREGKTR